MDLVILGLFGISLGGQSLPSNRIKALYSDRNWPELQRVLNQSKNYPLYRAVLAAAFNQNSGVTEKQLRAVINAAPHSEDAYEAYEQLSHLYLRKGQYHRLMSVMEQRWVAFPEKVKENAKEKLALGVFRGLPDQTISRFRPSVLTHDRGHIFIPISINDNAATYFFDSGAWVSSISESEARRFGMDIIGASGSTGTMTAASSFRMAVAKEVQIGGIRFRNVSFAVFTDHQEPFSALSTGRKGIIGIPLILAFRTLRWVKDGKLEIGAMPRPFDLSKANIYFDDDHIVVTSAFRSQKVLATLDTGAESTDIFAGFAKQFPDLVESGQKDTREIRGIGGAATFESVTVPEVAFRIGTVETFLRPAHVITNKTGANCCAANFGMDILKQATAFSIDFGAMRLELEPN
jgi:hypothetical protein